MTLPEENVWDYPRPAVCEQFSGALKIVVAGQVLAQTTRGFRTLETSHPPTYDFPPDDVAMALLSRNDRQTLCEWKGRARYVDFTTAGGPIQNIGWFYSAPTPGFAPIKDYISFYASKAQACYVMDEKVQAQEGDFYGGWITSNLKGPFKGGAGTFGW